MRALFIIPFLLITKACNPAKTVESEVTPGSINAQAPYLWEATAFPRDIRISNSFTTTDEVTNLRAMSGAWETAVENKKNFFTDTNRTPEVDSASLSLDSLGNDGVNGIYKITHWPLELSSGALAVTQLFGRRFNISKSNEYVRIEHGDILINDDIYDFRTGDTGTAGTYDLRTVVLHEMGHYLGLSHKYGNTVMVPSVSSTSVNRAPTSIDAYDIASKYGISIGSSGSQMVTSPLSSPTYQPEDGDEGQKIKIMIELRADGQCVHKENGIVTRTHQTFLTKKKGL
jgi:hypothetical protein